MVLSLSKVFVKFCLKAVLCLTMVGENFQISGVQVTGKCICQSKNLKFYQKTFQIRIITSPAERNHSFPQGAFFQKSIFPLAKKEIMS